MTLHDEQLAGSPRGEDASHMGLRSLDVVGLCEDRS